MAAGCTDPAAVSTGRASAGLIYGDDSRRDVYAVDDARSAQIAVQSTLAFMSDEHLTTSSAGQLEVVSDSLGAVNHLCPGEAFETQPAAATCSGVLIDDQLVLTAGHCIPDDTTCGDQLLIFDYAFTDPERPIAVDQDAVYRCKSVPVRRHGIDADGRRWDHGFIELDRPVGASRRPVPLTPEALPLGSHVTVIGYPSGLPVKVDAGGKLLYDRPCLDYFTLNSDTFQASSGSGVFDDEGRLAGIFVRGGIDYEFVPERGCAVARRILAVTDPSRAEQASHAAAAIASLCASGWASTRLCSASTDHRQTPADPPPASCMSGPPGTGLSGGCSAIARQHGSCPSGSAIIATVIAALTAGRRRRQRTRRLVSAVPQVSASQPCDAG